MPERAAVFQNIQLGVESVPGTGVAANKRLQAMQISPASQIEASRFKPMGQKWLSLVAIGQEWVEAGLGGFGTYNEIIYPLSSVLNTAVITTPGGGSSSRKWTFTPASTSADSPKTFTIEQGDTSLAHKFAHGIVTEFGLAFSRAGNAEISGSMLGAILQAGATLTGSPTTITPVPIVGNQISIYMDTTAAGLGVSKLTRVLSAEWTVGDRFNPVWALDAAQTSFAATVETEEPAASIGLVLEADAAGMALYTPMRAGDTRFIRIRCVGAIIEGAIPYELCIDFSGKITEVAEFGSEDGVFTTGYTFEAAHDATWGKAMEVYAVNTLTAL